MGWTAPLALLVSVTCGMTLVSIGRSNWNVNWKFVVAGTGFG